VCNIEYFQPVRIRNKGITKLNCDATRIAQEPAGILTSQARMERIRAVYNKQPFRSSDIETMSRRDDIVRSREHASGITCDVAVKEIIVRISVDDGRDV